MRPLLSRCCPAFACSVSDGVETTTVYWDATFMSESYAEDAAFEQSLGDDAFDAALQERLNGAPAFTEAGFRLDHLPQTAEGVLLEPPCPPPCQPDEVCDPPWIVAAQMAADAGLTLMQPLVPEDGSEPENYPNPPPGCPAFPEDAGEQPGAPVDRQEGSGATCVGVLCGAHGTCVAGACECRNDFTGDNCEQPPASACGVALWSGALEEGPGAGRQRRGRAPRFCFVMDADRTAVRRHFFCRPPSVPRPHSRFAHAPLCTAAAAGRG